MHPDRFRRQVGRSKQRRYFDDLPACPLNPNPDPDANLVNVTGITKAWNGDFNAFRRAQFGPLDAHRSAEYAVAHLADLNTEDPDDAYRRIVRAAIADLKRAVERGTAVHDWIEQRLNGNLPTLVDPLAEPYLDSAAALLSWLDPEPLLIEAVVFSQGDSYGGTLDSVLISKALGGTAIVDWKTRGSESKNGAYAKEFAQLGLLAAADYCIVAGPDGEPVRKKLPHIDVVAVCSITPSGFAVYTGPVVEAIEVGRHCFATWSEQQQGETLAASKAFSLLHEGDATPAVDVVTAAFPGTEVVPRHQLVTEQLPTDLDVLKARWPHPVPGPKAADRWTDADMDAIEKAFALSFTDPVTPAEPAAPPVLEVVPQRPRPADDHGTEPDPQTVKHLEQRAAAATKTQRALVEKWRKQGDRAGVAWRRSPGGHLSTLNYEISNAAVWLAEVADTDGEDDVLVILDSALGTDVVADSKKPGAVLGALTIDQAVKVARLAQAWTEGEVRFTADGVVEVVVA
jgi:hypothetical protein